MNKRKWIKRCTGRDRCKGTCRSDSRKAMKKRKKRRHWPVCSILKQGLKSLHRTRWGSQSQAGKNPSPLRCQARLNKINVCLETSNKIGTNTCQESLKKRKKLKQHGLPRFSPIPLAERLHKFCCWPCLGWQNCIKVNTVCTWLTANPDVSSTGVPVSKTRWWKQINCIKEQGSNTSRQLADNFLTEDDNTRPRKGTSQ